MSQIKQKRRKLTSIDLLFAKSRIAKKSFAMRSNAKIARRKVSKFRDEIERESIERRIETNSWHQCTSVCSRRSFMREWNRNRESCGVGRDYSRPTGTSHFRRSARVKLSWRMRGLEDSVAFNRPSRTCLSGVSIVPYLSLPVQRTLEGTFFSILDQILCR